jgi:hypothetical protein
MHDEYTMRRSTGSAIDASPIRRLDCAGFQVNESRATRKPVLFSSVTLRKRPSNAIAKKARVRTGRGPHARFIVSRNRFRSVDLSRILRLRPAVFFRG